MVSYIPLNSEEAPVAPADPRRALRPIDVPVIEFMTEFEVGTGPGAQLPDSDAKVGAHRIYELGAVVHGSSMIDGNPPRDKRPNMVQLAAKGYPLAQVRGEEAGNVCPLPISDVPHGPLARAALDNLLRWVDKGVAPLPGDLAPHAVDFAADGGRRRRAGQRVPAGAGTGAPRLCGGASGAARQRAVHRRAARLSRSHEAQDAFDMTQWLARQSWSDGKAGVYGCSNTGDAALHAMTMRPPALKAVFAGCFSWNKYDAFRRGGIFAQ